MRGMCLYMLASEWVLLLWNADRVRVLQVTLGSSWRGAWGTSVGSRHWGEMMVVHSVCRALAGMLFCEVQGMGVGAGCRQNPLGVKCRM